MAREQFAQGIDTAPIEAPFAGGGEVINPTTTEVVNPTETATMEPPTIAGDDYDSDSGDSFQESISTIDSEEDFDAYNLEYKEEDEDLFFFKNLCTDETEEGIQTMIFSTTDLDALKEKEKNLRAKEDSKYFRNKEIDSKLYE